MLINENFGQLIMYKTIILKTSNVKICDTLLTRKQKHVWSNTFWIFPKSPPQHTHTNESDRKIPEARPTLTVAHHDFQKLDDDFRTGPDQHLSFASLLGIVNGLESIAQHVHTHHLDKVFWLYSVDDRNLKINNRCIKRGTNGRRRQAGRKIINTTATERGSGEEQQRFWTVSTRRAVGAFGRDRRQRSPANYRRARPAERRPRVCA